MNELHGRSQILPEARIERFRAAFDASYALETAYPPDQRIWTPDHGVIGHCALVVLTTQELLGGEIVFLSSLNHFWNILPDSTQHDFTRSQFPDILSIQGNPVPAEREKMLYSPEAREAQTPKRYEIFSRRVVQALSRIDNARYPLNSLSLRSSRHSPRRAST